MSYKENTIGEAFEKYMVEKGYGSILPVEWLKEFPATPLKLGCEIRGWCESSVKSDAEGLPTRIK